MVQIFSFFLTYHIDDVDVDNDELTEVCGSRLVWL